MRRAGGGDGGGSGWGGRQTSTVPLAPRPCRRPWRTRLTRETSRLLPTRWQSLTRSRGWTRGRRRCWWATRACARCRGGGVDRRPGTPCMGLLPRTRPATYSPLAQRAGACAWAPHVRIHAVQFSQGGGSHRVRPNLAPPSHRLPTSPRPSAAGAGQAEADEQAGGRGGGGPHLMGGGPSIRGGGIVGHRRRWRRRLALPPRVPARPCSSPALVTPV